LADAAGRRSLLPLRLTHSTIDTAQKFFCRDEIGIQPGSQAGKQAARQARRQASSVPLAPRASGLLLSICQLLLNRVQRRVICGLSLWLKHLKEGGRKGLSKVHLTIRNVDPSLAMRA
jgi:hypothetical protein